MAICTAGEYTPVCERWIAVMRTRSAGGPRGFALLLTRMAPAQVRPYMNRHAATKAACSVAMLWLLSMSLSSGIQYSTGEGMHGMYSGEATLVEATVRVSEGGRGMKETSGEAIKVGEGLGVGARGMRRGPTVVVAYMFCM